MELGRGRFSEIHAIRAVLAHHAGFHIFQEIKIYIWKKYPFGGSWRLRWGPKQLCRGVGGIPGCSAGGLGGFREGMGDRRHGAKPLRIRRGRALPCLNGVSDQS